MALNGNDLEIQNMFISLRDIEIDKLEKMIGETKINPNQIILKPHFSIDSHPGGFVMLIGYSLFSTIVHNYKDIMRRSGNDWKRRQKQLYSIMTKLKENGYDLEMTPEVYNYKGVFYKYDNEHKRPLAISLYSGTFNSELAIFLLGLGSKPNNYETSNCTIIPTLKENYPLHELLYQLIKYGADVNQPYNIRGNKKTFPIDAFNAKYKGLLLPEAYKCYSKERIERVMITKELLEQGKKYVDRKEEEERIKLEAERKRQLEEERKKLEAEQKRQLEEERIKLEAERKRQFQEEERKRMEQKEVVQKPVNVISHPKIIPKQPPVPLPPKKEYHDKEAGAYLVLAMSNISFITTYGEYVPEEFSEGICKNIACLFQVIKEKMSPEILEKIKCELPENYQKLL